MTNTQNTPEEALESGSLRCRKGYIICPDTRSGGVAVAGHGLDCEVEFLDQAGSTILRHTRSFWGVGDGEERHAGTNFLNDQQLSGNVHKNVNYDDYLCMETPASVHPGSIA